MGRLALTGRRGKVRVLFKARIPLTLILSPQIRGEARKVSEISSNSRKPTISEHYCLKKSSARRIHSTRYRSAIKCATVLKKSFHFFVVALGSALLPVVCFAESFTIEQVLSAPFPYGLTSAPHSPRVAWVFDNKGAEGNRFRYLTDSKLFELRLSSKER